MVIHQLVPNFVPGDATGQAALHFRLLIRRLGHAGDLFSAEVHPSLHSLVKPASHLCPTPDDLVLYHHGIASSLSGQLLHLPCRKGLVFHNISPEVYYRGTPVHEALVSGRAQLAAMAPHVELAIGVSNFNASELQAAGYRNIHTVPLFIEPQRFSEKMADGPMKTRLLRHKPYILSVSRIVPHKRFEDLLSFFEELRRRRPDVQLLLGGGYAPGDAYFRRLQKKAESIGHVTFLGRLSNEELVACYRQASLFVSMSEHEGFGVPFLEAFACEVPVLAYAAAAVPETLGNHGVAFTEKNFAALAEVAKELLENEPLRKEVIAGQTTRLHELSAKNAQTALDKALTSLPMPKRNRKQSPSRRPHVGMVVQRYGANIVGGAEAHARQIAQRLSPHWDITVLTSCAQNHLTWANEFQPGSEKDGPISVLRFPSERPRDMRPFNRVSRTLFRKPLDLLSEENWVAMQGPLLPDLMRHLACQNDSYDGFVFFTYLYAPTVWGLPKVASKALLVPTAHDEPPFYMDTFLDVFERPRALLCNTVEEMELIQKRTPHAAPARVVGVGIEPPPAHPEHFRHKFKLQHPYLLYVGRVEEGKGVGELLKFHQAWLRSLSSPVALVFAGQASMSVAGRHVHYLGPISEQDKFNGMAGALATAVPSKLESLSLVTLESMSVGTPVLGHGACSVVAGHLRRSSAGLTYTSQPSFETALKALQENRKTWEERAVDYAAKYKWSEVTQIYLQEMQRVMEKKS